MRKSIFILLSCLFIGVFTACNNEDDAPVTGVTGIPDNSLAGPSPYVDPSESNVNIPNVGFNLEEIGGVKVVNMNMTGIYDKLSDSWLTLNGTQTNNQNIWLEIDGVPRSIKAERNAESRSSSKKALDLVFLVDNSGSMSEEADTIAAEIESWATELSAMFDLKLGCVGYAESDLSGALDMSIPDDLYDFLNRKTGTSRTKGFAGTRAAALEAIVDAGDYYTGGECGAAALHFADKNFTFRSGANRLYVNFTDEPNQPNGNADYSVESVSQNLWGVHQGTIHTVFSDEYYPTLTDEYWDILKLYDEKPWQMSVYTGGEILFAPYDFEGISLSTLPVTDALRNSYNVKFHFTEDLGSGTHTVKITIQSPDKKVKAVREFSNVDFTR